jgi:type VI protein secretion system component Hcp
MRHILLAPAKLVLLLVVIGGGLAAGVGASAQSVSGPVTIDIGGGAFAALSWEFAVKTQVDSSTTRTRSTPSLSTLRVTRRIGAGSASMLSASLRGEVLPRVILVQGDLTIELKNARLAAVELQGAGYANELAAEIVEFDFEEIFVKLGQDEVQYSVRELS